ncbi:MAG TPA: lipopolysaccharide assembly protein LapA domain-containing protein [Stellaceae bacterium]|nr:lipopolysaccharide assembly protein LapA domain-containing protein [Stellaceae bacterium]
MTALVAAVLVSFAVSNRESVALGFWPLPFIALTPLYLLAFASLLLGFAAGVCYAWIGRRRLKRELRRRAREIEALKRELAARDVPREEAIGVLPPVRAR